MTSSRNTVWGRLSVPSDRCLRIDTGGCVVHVRAYEDEWHLRHEYAAHETVTGALEPDGFVETACPENAVWNRFVTAGNDKIELLPALPDRPLVIRPKSAISILPGRRGQFFFSIPVWLRFSSAASQKPQMISEIPSVVLSNIWFGDPAAGELCYSLDSSLERHERDVSPGRYRAVCPLHLANRSSEMLSFQRICVHVENLSLFAARTGLWTNEVRVTFRGAEQITHLTIVPGAPKAKPDAERLTEARRQVDRNVIRKSFDLIKQAAGL